MNNEFDLDSMFTETDSVIEPEILENPNIKPVATQVTPKRSMSFNTTQPKVSDKPKKIFITKEIQIDKFNVKRERLELTPSVCDVCAFDIAAKRFGNWYGVPEREHENIKNAVIEHKRVVHPINQNMIVEEDQIPTEWLGSTR